MGPLGGKGGLVRPRSDCSMNYRYCSWPSSHSPEILVVWTSHHSAESLLAGRPCTDGHQPRRAFPKVEVPPHKCPAQQPAPSLFPVEPILSPINILFWSPPMRQHPRGVLRAVTCHIFLISPPHFSLLHKHQGGWVLRVATGHKGLLVQEGGGVKVKEKASDSPVGICVVSPPPRPFPLYRP